MSTPLNLFALLLESKRIINAHSRHFLALSVLFLLPLSFALAVFPTLHHLFLSHSSTLNSRILLSLSSYHLSHSHVPSPDTPFPTSAILLSVLFSLFFLFFSLLATASITYSVFHGFYGRPVKLFSAVKSALVRFFPLLITTLLLEIFLFGAVFVTGSFSLLAVEAVQLAGFRFELGSPFVVALIVAVSVVLLVFLVYVQLYCSLASVIVVVESTWGLQPLKRSYYLTKGMIRVAFWLMLFFKLLTGVLVWASSGFGSLVGRSDGDGWDWAVVVQIVITSALLVLLFLYNIAAHTVLYMYCKAARGELAWEIAEEFARDYVSLPFDDGKVPHVVSVAYYS